MGRKREENYSEVDIEGKKYRYLRSQTTVENRYLRHQNEAAHEKRLNLVCS